MKKTKRSVISTISVLLIFILGMGAFNLVYTPKFADSVYKLKAFYRLPENSVDLLVLGSSHAYHGVNTAVLWRENGISAFDLCGPAQPIYNSYFYLEEALKTQKPKLVLMDLFTIHYTDDFSSEAYAIKNTYGLRPSPTRVAAIKASFDTDTLQFQFPLLQYHGRYGDLSSEDFYPYLGNRDVYADYKGFYCYLKTEKYEKPDFSGVTEESEISEKNLEYLKKIVETCGRQGIQIIFTILPFGAANAYEQKFFNAAERTAGEMGVPFCNFLTKYADAYDLDYSTDCSDTDHLNHIGNQKLTRFLAKLIEPYGLPDHRGDPVYDTWERDADVFYKQLETANLMREYSDLGRYAKMLANGRYYLTVSSTSFDGSVPVDVIAPFFEALGISRDEYSKCGGWMLKDGKIRYSPMTERGIALTQELGRFHDAALIREELKNSSKEPEDFNGIHVDGARRTGNDDGLNVCVFDTLTQNIVDVMHFSYVDGKIKHS